MLWEKITLGEVAKRGGGNIQTGPFGSQLHASDYVKIGISSIMPKNIGDNVFYSNDIAKITEKDAIRLEKYRVKFGDIVYSRRGDVEKRSLVRAEEEGWLCGTGCLRVRLGSDEFFDPSFITYFLGLKSTRQWIVRHAVGATMPNLNTSILSAVPVLAPPILEQKAIALVLREFDDKIENNQRMNETLEEMARTIFKSWFVDFDPVHAKAAGKTPVHMDADTAALFPSSFGNDGLPKGWAWRKLGECISLTKGRSYKSAELQDSDTALVSLKSFLRGGGYRPDGLKAYTGTYKDEQILVSGDLIVALTDVTQAADVIGKPAIVRSNNEFKTLVASLDVGVIRPIVPSVSIPFLYCMMMMHDFQAHIYGHTSGTTVLHLGKAGLPTYEFGMPACEALDKFTVIAQPIFYKIELNENNSITLAALRDTLLPKLMSGEIRVADAEREVEKAV